MNDLLDQQIAYYRARAPHYDDVYERNGLHDRGDDKNAAWFRDLAQLEAWFDTIELGDEVLETVAIVSPARSRDR